MCPSKPRLEICVKKIWGRSHIYKNTSRKQAKKKERVCIWKCICILKATAKTASLVPVLTDAAGDTEAPARQWHREGLAAPCPVPFTFPVPELLLSNKLLCGFWWVSEKNFNNVVCNIIMCLFFMWQGLFFCVFFNHMKKTHKTQRETEYTFY